MRRAAVVLVLAGVALLLAVLWLLRKTPELASGPGARPRNDSSAPTASGRTSEDTARSAELHRSTEGESPAAREEIAGARHTAKVLVALDEHQRPLGEARAILFEDGAELEADGAGRIVFESDPGRGQVGLVGAPGYCARFFELVADETEIELPVDPGLPVEVRWKDTGEPALGSVALRLSWLEAYRHDLTQMPDAAYLRLIPSEFAVDAQGNALVLGCKDIHKSIAIRDPHGAITVVDDIKIGNLEIEDGWRPLRVELERDPPRSEFEFVDPQGTPLAGRPVTIRVQFEHFERTTDAQGRVTLALTYPESIRQFSDWRPRVEIDLGNGRRWASTSRKPEGVLRYVVEHRRLRAHLAPTQALGPFSIATVGLRRDFDRSKARLPAAWPGIPFPQQGLEEWRAIRPGEELVLDSGWQGERTGALLRHDPTGLVIDIADVDALGTFLLRAPELCRLELSSAVSGAIPDAPLQIGERARLTLLPSSLPTVVEVPRQLYSVTWMLPGASVRLPTIDATAAEARAVLPLAPPRWIHGSLKGRLSGPMPHVDLAVRLQDGSPIDGWETNASGEFRCALLSDEAIRVEPVGFKGEECWATDQRTFQLDAGASELHMVLPEAELRIAGGFSDSLADEAWFRLTRNVAPGSRPAEVLRGLGLKDSTIYLAPADYKLEQVVAKETLYETSLRVQDGESRSVELPTLAIALLEIRIPNDSGLRGELRISLRAPDGSLRMDHDRVGIPWSAEAEGRVLVRTDPGRHDVEVEGAQLFRGDDETASLPPWNWSDVVDCKAGERTRVRIQLP